MEISGDSSSRFSVDAQERWRLRKKNCIILPECAPEVILGIGFISESSGIIDLQTTMNLLWSVFPVHLDCDGDATLIA